MKQTAVEWLCEKYYLRQDIEIIKEAKEIEKKQIESAWKASEQNMRSQFSSSEYKNITFENWLNK